MCFPPLIPRPVDLNLRGHNTRGLGWNTLWGGQKAGHRTQSQSIIACGRPQQQKKPNESCARAEEAHAMLQQHTTRCHALCIPIPQTNGQQK